MGHVFRRSSGRAWRLRRRSMELWPRWAESLSTPSDPLTVQTPLLQLAASEREADLQRQLAQQRSALGLDFLEPGSLHRDHADWPVSRHGGLLSRRDGRIDPLALLKALRRELATWNVTLTPSRATRLERHQGAWRVGLGDGDGPVTADHVVVCSGLASQELLLPLGHGRPMEPVLGQVLHLQLTTPEALHSHWPAVLVSHGVNLVRLGRDQLWLGATLEPGETPLDAAALAMRALEGDAPRWLMEASELSRWHGLRARPNGRPAPLLEVLEQTLQETMLIQIWL